METSTLDHSGNALTEIQAGADMLAGMLPDLVERILRVDAHDEDLCRPTPWVPYPFDLVSRIYSAQLHMLHRVPEPGTEIAVVNSMQFALSWDRTILQVEPAVAALYRARGMAVESAFQELFKTTRQTYYVAVEGVVESYQFDALWVYRDRHPVDKSTHLRVCPTRIGDPTPAALTIPFLAIPEASTWEEAVERGAWLTAHYCAESNPHTRPDQIAHQNRLDSLRWEPLVALLTDLLTGPAADAFDYLSERAQRSDARIGTVRARCTGGGQVGYTL